MKNGKFFQQLGLGVASLTFGVALSIFIYAFSLGLIVDIQSGILYLISFIFMLRFWWKYTKIFVRSFPSHTFLHFMFDFIISFFGILTVLFVNNIQMWSLLGAASMLGSVIRCRLSWKGSKGKLNKTFRNSIIMLVIFLVIYGYLFFF